MFSLTLLAGVVSALLGALFPLLREAIGALRRKSKGEKFFSSPIGKGLLQTLDLDKEPDGPELLFTELSETSKKMDSIVSRIQEYTKVREVAVTKLEEQLGELTQQEGQLRKTIEELQHVPLPAAEYFASLVNKGEKSRALRDYVLFTAGVVVSAVVTVVLKHFGLA
jgi:hypothetical protein